jgi:hypothetical protein
MNLSEQEEWLVKKLQELYKIEDDLKKKLAMVRGGKNVYIKDEKILKDAQG